MDFSETAIGKQRPQIMFDLIDEARSVTPLQDNFVIAANQETLRRAVGGRQGVDTFSSRTHQAVQVGSIGLALEGPAHDYASAMAADPLTNTLDDTLELIRR